MTQTLDARSPADLIAAVPVVLGFLPDESLVMLTFGADQPFHGRVDLPAEQARSPGEIAGLADGLLRPCLLHHVTQVVFVFYTADSALAARVSRRACRVFARAGIEIVAVLRADDAGWCRVPRSRAEQETRPTPHDPAHHRFLAQAVFAGRVVRPSREAVRATLAAVPEEVEQTRARQRGLRPRGAADVEWVADRLREWATDRSDPPPDDAARVLWCVRRVEVRDAALFAVRRESAPEHVRVWSGLLRRAPTEQVPSAAAVTAFAAWQAGDGALAWCALDRCFAVEPHHPLGKLLAACLTDAVAPGAWWEVVDRSRLETDTA